MQLELVQQHDETPRISKEFMDAPRWVQQIAYWVKAVVPVWWIQGCWVSSGAVLISSTWCAHRGR